MTAITAIPTITPITAITAKKYTYTYTHVGAFIHG
jgi:hypothetical protein